MQQRFYEVQWKDFEERTWEPARHLDLFFDVKAFWAESSYSVEITLPEQAGEHMCHFYNWFGKRHQDLKSHWTRGCASAPRIKVGSKAEAAVKKAKADNMHKAVGCVELAGIPLKNSLNFRYLEFMYQADGNWRHAVEAMMALSRTRFRTMYQICDSNILSLEVEIQLYESAVLSVLVYGCEAW